MADFWSVVLGGAIAIFSTVAVKRWDEYRQSTALRAAFAAEIDALLKIAITRKHVSRAEGWIEKWRQGEDHLPSLFAPDQLRQDPVYAKNVDKIGLLGPEAGDVVIFYTNLEAVRINVLRIVRDRLKDMTTEQRIAWVQDALDIWRPNEELGRSLVERLRR
jgi:hypothetical protein